MAEEVKLVEEPTSPFVMRVKFALHLKGIKYESIPVDLYNKSQVLLDANPIYKKVPVLIHNGKPICESAVIIQYIDEAWPNKGPNILPKDPFERAQARFWADFVARSIFRIFGEILFKDATNFEELNNNLLIFEGILSKLENKPFFGGHEMGFVDLILSPLAVLLPGIPPEAPYALKEDMFPNFFKLLAAIREHPNSPLPPVEMMKAGFTTMIPRAKQYYANKEVPY